MSTARHQKWDADRTLQLGLELSLNSLIVFKKDIIIKDLTKLEQHYKTPTDKQSEPKVRTTRSTSSTSITSTLTLPKQNAFEQLCGCLTLVDITPEEAKQYKPNAESTLTKVLESITTALETHRAAIKSSIADYATQEMTGKRAHSNSNGTEHDGDNDESHPASLNDTKSIIDNKSDTQSTQGGPDYVTLWNDMLSTIDDTNDTVDYRLPLENNKARREAKKMFEEIILPYYKTAIRSSLLDAAPAEPSLSITDMKIAATKKSAHPIDSERHNELKKIFSTRAIATLSYRNSPDKILTHLIDKFNNAKTENDVYSEITSNEFHKKDVSKITTRLKHLEKTFTLTNHFCGALSKTKNQEISPGAIAEILEDLKKLYIGKLMDQYKTAIETITKKITATQTTSVESSQPTTHESKTTISTPEKSTTSTTTALQMLPTTPAQQVTTPTDPEGFIPSPPPAAPTTTDGKALSTLIDTKSSEKVITKEGVVHYLQDIIAEYKKFKKSFETLTKEFIDFFKDKIDGSKNDNLEKSLSPNRREEFNSIKTDIKIFAKDPENALAYMILLRERMDNFRFRAEKDKYIKIDKIRESQELGNQLRDLMQSLEKVHFGIVKTIYSKIALKLTNDNSFTDAMKTLCNATFADQAQLESFEKSLGEVTNTIDALKKLAELFKLHPNAANDGFIQKVLEPYAIDCTIPQTGSIRLFSDKQNEKLLAGAEAIFKETQIEMQRTARLAQAKIDGELRTLRTSLSHLKK